VRIYVKLQNTYVAIFRITREELREVVEERRRYRERVM